MRQRSLLTSRPAAVAGYQKWRDLLFLHWPVPAEDVQRLLPEGLTAETFDGDAWIGIVAFNMLGVRPRWFPPLPCVSAFLETNVRTYVTRDGTDPGVWFFSLDAASSLAVRIARWRWHLNYHRADLQLSRTTTAIACSGRRRSTDSAVGYTVRAELHADRPACAAAGSLEEFLVERYVMYAQRRDEALFRGEVRHIPYPIRPASVTSCDETMLAAAGIPVSGPPVHAVFCDGVDVVIHALQPVESARGEPVVFDS